MLIATKKNRQLRIPDEKKNAYIALGYTIKDTSGNIVSEPDNPAKQVETLTAENKALRAEVEALHAEITKLEAAAAKTTAKAKTTATVKKEDE